MTRPAALGVRCTEVIYERSLSAVVLTLLIGGVAVPAAFADIEIVGIPVFVENPTTNGAGVLSSDLTVSPLSNGFSVTTIQYTIASADAGHDVTVLEFSVEELASEIGLDTVTTRTLLQGIIGPTGSSVGMSASTFLEVGTGTNGLSSVILTLPSSCSHSPSQRSVLVHQV